MSTDTHLPPDPGAYISPKPKVVAMPSPRRDDLIDMLEGWLEDIKGGLVYEVALVAVMTNGTVESDWSNGADSLRLIGALAQVQHDLLSAGKEDE